MRKSTLSALFGILLLTVLPCQAQETSLYVLVLDNLSTDSTYFKVSHYPKVTFYLEYPQRSNCANLRFGGKVCIVERQFPSSLPLQSGQ